MALIGNVTSNTNSVANYHMIRSYNWDKFAPVNVTVWSYLDKNARSDLKEPLICRSYALSNNPQLEEITLNYLYEQLKLKSDFSSMTSDV